MEDAHKLFKIPKSECPDIWIRLSRHKWPKSWSSMEDPVVALERNLYGHPLAGLLWERQFEKILLKHEIVMKCSHGARIGRPDIPWSVNKLARSITKWTKACDKRLNRLISYIHHTCEYKQHCYVGNTAKQCRLGLFQGFDFAGDLEDSTSTSGIVGTL